jgi:prepilin peptidase CpaA
MTLGLLAYGILFWLGGMGAGDVKLAAAVGAWIGPGQLLIAMILTALVGGVMAMAWAVSSGFSKELLADTGNLIVTGIRGRWKRTDGEKPERGSDSEGPNSEGLNSEGRAEVVTKRVQRKMPYAPAIAIGTLLSFFAR